jgi:hypothetical protein
VARPPTNAAVYSSSQEYEDPGHAAEAVAKYNDGHFLGSQIKVELSLARAPGGKNGVSRQLTYSFQAGTENRSFSAFLD